MSGLACARTLAQRGVGVRVFDKARAPAGRVSTRRTDTLAFDHGAQYFTVRDPSFRLFVESLQRDGVVQPWQGEVVRLQDGQIEPTESETERWVGVPAMNVLAHRLVEDLDVTTGFEVAVIEPCGGGMRLLSVDGACCSDFDLVIVSAPGPQTASLVQSVAPGIAEQARCAQFAPCLAAMLAFEGRLPLDFDGAFVAESPLSWIARNSSKPGRSADEAWVLHGSPDWSTANLERDPSMVLASLLGAFAEAVGIAVPEPAAATVQRWRYALPTEPLPERYLFDAGAAVGACGDWCGGPRVEGAYLSGVAMATRVLAWVAGSEDP